MVDVEFDGGARWLIRSLDEGGVFSAAILATVALRRGRFQALAPASVEQERLLAFDIEGSPRRLTSIGPLKRSSSLSPRKAADAYLSRMTGTARRPACDGTTLPEVLRGRPGCPLD
jgi:hypothetical protein